MESKQPEFAEKCETCGAEVSSYSQKHRHCNGYWNQEWVFKCGCVVRFSPNFVSMVTEKNCPNDPMIKEANNRFKKEMDRLILYINKLKIDDEHKKALMVKVAEPYESESSKGIRKVEEITIPLEDVKVNAWNAIECEIETNLTPTPVYDLDGWGVSDLLERLFNDAECKLSTSSLRTGVTLFDIEED